MYFDANCTLYSQLSFNGPHLYKAYTRCWYLQCLSHSFTVTNLLSKTNNGHLKPSRDDWEVLYVVKKYLKKEMWVLYMTVTYKLFDIL